MEIGEDEQTQTIAQVARPGPAQNNTEVVASAAAASHALGLLLVFLLRPQLARHALPNPHVDPGAHPRSQRSSAWPKTPLASFLPDLAPKSSPNADHAMLNFLWFCESWAVTGCRKLRDTEFFSRQDPYVCLEYANTKLRTRTCTDGGKNPSFDDKFHIPLVEGLRELNVIVWNSNTLSNDDFIGSGRVQLHKVLTRGYDDSSWPLQTRHMRSAGEVKVIMHFDVSTLKDKMGRNVAASTTHTFPPKSAPAMPYTASSPSYPPSAPAPALASAMPYAASSPSYPPKSAPAPALASAMPYAASSPSYPPPAGYPAASSQQAYPTHSNASYPAPAYPSPPPHQPCPHEAYPSTAYPPQPHGQPYPPHPHEQPYPSQPHGQSYPPQPHGQSYPPQPYGQPPPAAQSPYPPAPYPGTYPPPPY